jgi:hypothetical protein
MIHAREDYNGRIVDLLEPGIREVLERVHDALLSGDLSAEDRVALASDIMGLYANVATANPIPDDEPVFLLRGQDVTAGYAVQAWIGQNASRDGDPELIRGAKEQLRRMQAWPVKKVADINRPEGS